MRRRIFAVGGMLFGLVLAILLVSTATFAETASLHLEQSGELGNALRHGRLLEIEHRWGEALTLYERVLKEFPQEESLEHRLELARLHYDVQRRYNDSSFRDVLGRMSLSETLDLYTEVLLKIQAHHVETPDWREFVDRGTQGFEVAISESTFVARQTVRLDSIIVSQFSKELRGALAGRTVETRSDARASVAMAAGLAEERLGIAANAVVLEYVCGATSALDAYSAYLTPTQLSDVYSQIEGNFVGLGIELKADDKSLLIVRVIANSPAEKAGLRSGDRIVAVDGQPTQAITTDQAADMLQGSVGSVAELTLVSGPSEPRLVRVRRQRVEVPSIDQIRIVNQDREIAYLRLNCFQKTTSRDLDAALWDLHRQGMKGLIMDLRGNPGGLLVTAVEVVDKFVDRGVIVSTRGRALQEDFVYSAHNPGTWKVPLVVLIDGDSASAAEIFAGAIRDHRRGTIVGDRSYGKGSVQGIFPLALSNAGVRLTTAKFYSPSGHPYSHVGVTPDIVVHRVARPIEGAVVLTPEVGQDDPVLTAGIEAVGRLMERW